MKHLISWNNVEKISKVSLYLFAPVSKEYELTRLILGMKEPVETFELLEALILGEPLIQD
jgi:hypothetical protein